MTAYPEAQRWLDYKALKLRPFWPGASIWRGGCWCRVADPRRRWSDLWSSMEADIGSMGDKLRVLRWAISAATSGPDVNWTSEEKTSLELLRAKGFSEPMIESFWRPWLSGIFLEPDLETSSRMLEFVFVMFTRGATDGDASHP
ncbi:MAG: hypothetical protein J6386_15805 [Candidatus Synoicihabitans palmerolidicus]|nr:hypothetical protein [Candidatus Synoicihabitans palmerolidicus]